MVFSGVSVSIRPNLLLSRVDRKGRRRAGMIKVYLSKTFPLDERAGSYVSTVAQRYVAEQYGNADPNLVIVIDVFAREVHVSPKAITRRLDDVAAACEEIAVRWGSI